MKKQKFKSEKKDSSTLRDHSRSTYALQGREVVKTKACIYCCYEVILLFRRVHGEGLFENHQIGVNVL